MALENVKTSMSREWGNHNIKMTILPNSFKDLMQYQSKSSCYALQKQKECSNLHGPTKDPRHTK